MLKNHFIRLINTKPIQFYKCRKATELPNALNELIYNSKIVRHIPGSSESAKQIKKFRCD